MLFNPKAERERIYAAAIDWDHAGAYLSGIAFSDAECAMAASAMIAAKSTRSKASEAHAVILRRWPMMTAEGKQIAAALTKDGGAWWRELLAEFEGREIGGA